jgi:hypothetical protein
MFEGSNWQTMPYQTPRDELLLGILVAVAGARFNVGLVVLGVAIGLTAYIAVAFLGVGPER